MVTLIISNTLFIYWDRNSSQWAQCGVKQLWAQKVGVDSGGSREETWGDKSDVKFMAKPNSLRIF